MIATGKNISIFGPAHVGKTTLCGYIKTRFLSESEFEKKERKIKEKVGKSYNIKYRFNYFVDNIRDIKTSYHKKTGTTKSTQTKRVKWDENSDIVLIDTPGGQHKSSSKGRGLFLGDIGLFIIEISKILQAKKSPDDKKLYFSQLLLWKKLKDKRNLVIAISKMDEPDYNFSEDIFLQAKEYLNTFFENCSIPIIPISIEMNSRDDHNIYKKSEQMSWYRGQTLKQTLDNLLITPDVTPNEDFFMIFHKVFKKVPGVGAIWEGKVLKGLLRKEDEIKMCPVKINGKYHNITAKIKNIRFVDSSINTDTAVSGDIIGLDISGSKAGNDKIKKGSFNMIDTSCATLASTKIKYGNITKFIIHLDSTNINKSIREEISEIVLFDEIKLLWFGRTVAGTVIEKRVEGKKAYLCIEHEYRQVALPINKNEEFFFNNFLIKKNSEYFSATITDIGLPSTLECNFKNQDLVIKCFSKKSTKFGYDFSISENHVNIHCASSYVAPLKQIFKNETISEIIKENDLSLKINLANAIF